METLPLHSDSQFKQRDGNGVVISKNTITASSMVDSVRLAKIRTSYSCFQLGTKCVTGVLYRTGFVIPFFLCGLCAHVLNTVLLLTGLLPLTKRDMKCRSTHSRLSRNKQAHYHSSNEFRDAQETRSEERCRLVMHLWGTLRAQQRLAVVHHTTIDQIFRSLL